MDIISNIKCLIIWSLAFLIHPIVGNQITQDPSMIKGEKPNQRRLNVKLVTEFKGCSFKDISDDGKHLILYQSSVKQKIYSISLSKDKKRISEKENDTSGKDELRVVEFDTWRIVSTTGVNWWPDQVQFIPGTNEIFFREPVNEIQAKNHFKRWNFISGDIKLCAELDALSFFHVSVLNNHQAFASTTGKETGIRKLGLLDILDCRLVQELDADPELPGVYSAGADVSFSPDRYYYAYEVARIDSKSSWEVRILDTKTMKIVGKIDPMPLRIANHIVYSKDGKRLLIFVSNTYSDTPSTKRYLLIYDTKTYKLINQLDVAQWRPIHQGWVSTIFAGSAAELSPDGRILAVANMVDNIPGISLYDPSSGEELSRAEYPKIIPKRNDPFAGEISKLSFTPDGKYLISGSRNSRVWEIQEILK